MNPIDWLFYIGPKVMHWLELLVYLVGLGVSVWAYRQSRKLGYLLLAVYLFFGVCSLSILPAINRAIRQRWYSQHELSTEAREQYTREFVALHEKYYPSAPSSASPINIRFPLGPIVLLAGICALAKRESRRSAEPSTGGNAAPPRASV